ncbi:hypothetical protein [Chamaesiphon sp. VAR_48_metabat_135_sub]|uniref:hypothetical protein n=1 Tax=Chamaesiphon sp. VAR_48_metabat_135_sub TaxID=2964699 RepID=UPI00286A7F88|nr:hypothetical protein [Chamaesiphon sp. VAR_48_metabat_135_sub]
MDFLRTTVDLLSNENRVLFSSIILLTVVVIISIAFNSITNKYLKDDVKDFQSRLWYSNPDVDRVIDRYENTNGVNTYVTALVTLDLILPIAYSLLFSIILTVELTHFKNSLYFPRDMRLLPLFLILVDWSENIAIIILIKQHQRLKSEMVKVASALTTAKWIGISLTIILIIAIPVVDKLKF